MRAFSLIAMFLPASFAIASSAEPAAPQLTSMDVEAWLDGFMPFAMARGDIAGSVVVLVKDGQILLQKGYGYADVKARKPVDPERTLFRPGSVSKLFTWTAVMQQVERGKLDLDIDINEYLDFEIPPGPGGEPLTLRNLMTHTPGFEQTIKELIGSDARSLRKLDEALKLWVPNRIYAPGTTPAYSNYATGLAGYLVERSSGLGFDDYVEQNIFQPLGMTRSTFRQPLPEAFEADMSKGYKLGSDEPHPYELINMSPAGALASTGADMGAFMIAHLQQGAYRENRILSAETAKQMHETPLTLLPPLNRMVLGFYETNINGRRAISHGGDTQYFHSNLHLFLDEGVGLYISMNSTGKDGAAGPLRDGLFNGFSDRYFPGPVPDGEVDKATAAEHARRISGHYILSRRIESSLVSLLNLATPISVGSNPDGTISVSILLGPNQKPIKWREISPYVWVEVGGKSRVAAKVENGRVVRFSFDDFAPIIFFERAPAAKSGAWLLPAAGVSLAILVLTVLLWPVAALVRRRYRQPPPFAGREARAYRLARIGALASALAIIAWAGMSIAMLEDLELMTPSLDPWLMALHILGTIGVFAGFALALWHLRVVWSSRRKWLARIWSVVLVLATAVLLWLAIAY
ncbi:MAG TPA: serine hydrolase domain-containing protein, partial [Steroidobacteraceae bacterium]